MRSRALIVLVVTLLLLVAGCEAYNVKYTLKDSAAMRATGGNSGCGTSDDAAHMAMPPTELGQRLALEAAQSSSAQQLPLGGEARTAQCSDDSCPWVWNDGLFYLNPFVFFWGIVRTSNNGRLPVSRHTDDLNGTIYCNFDSCQNPTGGTYPMYDTSQSYWGLRKVVMDKSSGAWQNVAYNTNFAVWLCETYEFQLDSVTNDSKRFGLSMFPPSHGGVVYPRINYPSQYEYCPNDSKKRIRVKSNRWLYPNCKPGFPWWAGLIIAIACFILVVALILIIWCCCVRRRNREQDQIAEEKQRTTRDNTSNVPTQSQLGMSRASTLTGGDYGDEDMDEYSSRE